MEIDILIDCFTDCLICAETGERCETDYRIASKAVTKKESLKLKAEGWKFDWSIPYQNGYKVYQLYLKNSDVVQGMIALKHIENQYYTHIDIVEAAPFNVGKEGKYKGVGAHLFAIACKESMEAGNDGYVQFTAKTELVDYYVEMLNAKCIDWHTLYIDTNGAVTLINKYFKRGGDYDSYEKEKHRFG